MMRIHQNNIKISSNETLSGYFLLCFVFTYWHFTYFVENLGHSSEKTEFGLKI